VLAQAAASSVSPRAADILTMGNTV
jgi:hypothetical protein